MSNGYKVIELNSGFIGRKEVGKMVIKEVVNLQNNYKVDARAHQYQQYK